MITVSLGFLLLNVGYSWAQCNGLNRTIFLRADNRMVQGFNGVTISGVDLSRCFELCSNNVDDKGKVTQCASFQFDSTSCILSNTNAQPFGNGVLTESTNEHAAIYQKICVPTTKTCEKPYAFDWTPQSVLLGFAPQVQHASTVSDCLKTCLEPNGGAPCRSAMFFYESQQCILNGETRRTRTDLFSTDTQGLIVDYFDNVCQDGDDPIGGATKNPLLLISPSHSLGVPAPPGYAASASPLGNYNRPPQPVPPLPGVQPYPNLPVQPNPYAPTQSRPNAPIQYPNSPSQQYGQAQVQPYPVPPPQPYNPYQQYNQRPVQPAPIVCDQYKRAQFVVTENMDAQEGLDRKIESADADNCQQWCENNKNERGEVFGCQAFSFDVSRRICTLTAGLSMPRGNLHLIGKNSVNFYEKVCLAHAQTCNGKFPFIRTPAHVLVGYAGEVRRVQALSDCLDACLYARTEIGYDCRSVIYYYSTTECIMNAETRLTRPDLFSGDTQGQFVDYFDNNCISSQATTPRVNVAPVPGYGLPAPQPQPQSPSPYGANSAGPNTATASVYAVNQWPTAIGYTSPTVGPDTNGKYGATQEPRRPGAKPTDNATFYVDCREDGIRVNVVFNNPTSGTLYAKNKYQTCREGFESVVSAQLKIPLSENEKDCGQEPTAPNRYALTVVLQQNGLGVSGLTTSDDIMYNVNCDVFPTRQSSTSGSTVSQDRYSQTTVGSYIRPGDGTNKNQPEAQVTMDLLRENVPVSNVLLGEQLEIHWRIAASPNVGFFVRDCFAERVGGNPPDPSPLQLIKDGCPDNAVIGRIMSYPVVKSSDGLVTNMTVFRFDGSRSVRLRCVIDMCAGECNPTRCLIKNRESQSLGRRKRAALERLTTATTALSTEKPTNLTLAVGTATASGVFTIVDELPSVSKQKSAVSDRRLFDETTISSISTLGASRGPIWNRTSTKSSPPSFNDVEAKESKSFLLHNGQVCLVRSLFVGLMTTLAIVCTIEGLIVSACCWSRYCSKCTSDEMSPYENEYRLRSKLISAIRKSSFFSNAFGDSNSSRGQSQRRRKIESIQSSVTSSSGDYIRNDRAILEPTSRRRPTLPIPTSATVSVHNRDRPISKMASERPSIGPPIPINSENPDQCTTLPNMNLSTMKMAAGWAPSTAKSEWSTKSKKTNECKSNASSGSKASTIDCANSRNQTPKRRQMIEKKINTSDLL